MAWVVDTCIVLDVLIDDPEFGASSAQLLERYTKDGLIICPVTYVELAPAFKGQTSLQNEFLDNVGINYRAPWGWVETQAAHDAWHLFIQLRRTGALPKRPLSDILIGAFAYAHGGLLTRNEKDFKRIFKDLKIRGGKVSSQNTVAD
jgi:predicted nucleic acid-binding protein